MNKLNILYVEDSFEQQMLFKLYVKSKPYNFRFAGSFNEAIKLSKDQRFDLVFLDWNMPGEMDAPEFVEKISKGEKDQQTPCYVVTGFTEKDIRDEVEDLPIDVDGILSKPVRKEDLLDLLDSYSK